MQGEGKLNKYNIDLNAVLIKPLYLGLLINIFIPVAIIGVAYSLEESGGFGSIQTMENPELLFWVLTAVAVLDGAVAIFLKQKLFFAPMIKSKETFIEDFKSGFFIKSIVCIGLTASISIYGLIIYLLGGSFNQLLFFAFISFIAFQLIRPRLRFSEKVLEAQEKFVDEGRFFVTQK